MDKRMAGSQICGREQRSLLGGDAETFNFQRRYWLPAWRLHGHAQQKQRAMRQAEALHFKSSIGDIRVCCNNEIAPMHDL